MSGHATTRREFIQQGAALVAAAGLTGTVHAEGKDEMRVALIGCGGRGTGAAQQALAAHPSVRIVAMADGFKDRLDESLKALQKAGGERANVPADHQFVGLDAYKQAIAAADIVLLATPPWFRPDHFEYAVEKGKHCFVEKPVATDAPGVRRILAANEKAKAKNLSVVSGLCWRYHPPRVETMKRVAEGGIGDIVAVETVYNSGGVWEPRITREQAKSDMEYQMRNWYYYTWLSGDHIAEQAVHGLDTMGWAMGDKPPARCFGVGGRQRRTDPKYGNIWDHFSLVYEYESGVRGYHTCRHWAGTPTRVKDIVLGAKGRCDVFDHVITGEKPWKYEGPDADMYQTEINAFIASIRDSKPINNGERMCSSTMLAIIGRMAAYTGEVIGWDQAMASTQELGPKSLAWGEAPKVEIAVPGITKFS